MLGSKHLKLLISGPFSQARFISEIWPFLHCPAELGPMTEAGFSVKRAILRLPIRCKNRVRFQQEKVQFWLLPPLLAFVLQSGSLRFFCPLLPGYPVDLAGVFFIPA